MKTNFTKRHLMKVSVIVAPYITSDIYNSSQKSRSDNVPANSKLFRMITSIFPLTWPPPACLTTLTN